MLLYGMNFMGDALQKLAGNKLEKALEKMAGNIFKSVLLGAFVTGVIQTSTGTTVMVVGFVNAGIMNLKQAAGVIMGANIGTTVTAQIIALDTSGNSAAMMEYIKPSNFCYILIALGVILIMSSKKSVPRNFGEVLTGLGVLFLGIATMEGAVSGLKESPAFEMIFATLKNPVVGILAGAAITAILHSSSASVGILQAAAASGAVTFSAAIPIIMGQNIGTCITALTSSIGGNKNAKRAAMIHFYFNLIGSIVFIAVIYTLNAVFKLPFWEDNVTKTAIANFHTVFNIVTTLMFLPFSKVLIKLAEKTIRDTAEQDKNEVLDLLDARFYSSPSVALEQCHKVVKEMGVIGLDNFYGANNAILDGKHFSKKKFLENEDIIDRCEARLNAYMVELKDENLSETGKRHYTEILHAIGDYERIGDYCENLMDQYFVIQDKSVTFTDSAMEELRIMSAAVEEIIILTNECFHASDESLLPKIEALEAVIDTMKETLKSRHIERLQAGTCTANNGISFLDIIHNYEKISDHCANIALYVALAKDVSHEFDVHEFRRLMGSRVSADYKKAVDEYDEKYVVPISKKPHENANTAEVRAEEA